MKDAGYQPKAMIQVMKILEESGGGKKEGSDFSSSHPSPASSIAKIKEQLIAMGVE